MAKGPEQKMKKILVVRNDKLGDFMLAWPALARLKRSLPDACLTVLVPPYTSAIAKECPWVDDVLLDTEKLSYRDFIGFDHIITLFSTSRIGFKAWLARIPERIAPATKLAQLFYNKKLSQRRSKSEKPEYQYNIDLVDYFLSLHGIPLKDNPPPYWPQVDHTAEKKSLAALLNICDKSSYFMLHPGSGGSANNLSIEQYSALITSLDSKLEFKPRWIVTAGPGEEKTAEKLVEITKQIAPNTKIDTYISKRGIVDFAKSLAAAELFIAGSTGPLHVAAALDVPTVGFFPAKRSSTPLRWRPCNSEGKTLGISCPEDAEGNLDNMQTIDPIESSNIVFEWIRKNRLH